MTLEQRIWHAHPLEPQYRCVLLAVVRQVPDGVMQVLVNRGALARELDTSSALVGKALNVGAALGLCEPLKNGIVAFMQEGLFMEARPTSVAVEGSSEVIPEVTAGAVKVEFARQWQRKYGQTYYFDPKSKKEHVHAASVARAIPLMEELRRRIANYLVHPDPFYTQCAHSFSLFATRLNQFAVNVRQVAIEDDPAYRRIPRKENRL